MKTEADRIKRWREQKKAEGKTSLTVLLSQEARVILTEEKKKTGESYGAIIEKALQAMKLQANRPAVPKHFPRREDVLARASANGHQPSGSPPADGETGEQPARILIDDLDKQANIWGMNRNQTGEDQNRTYNLQTNEGFITRLFRFSAGSPFRGRKKWFK